VVPHGKSYLAEVHGASSGKPEASVAVLAEVAGEPGRWHFVNFVDPQGQTLRDVLKRLRTSREKPGG